MSNDKSVFGISLEDYSFPRYFPSYRPYVGSKEEAMLFAERLAGNMYAATRYEKLIQGIRNYDENPHTIYEIAGQKHQVMTPMEEVYRRELTLEGHRWEYQSARGSLYNLEADRIWVSQIVVRNERWALRCSKAAFEGLRIMVPGIGDVYLNGEVKGFPGMIYYQDDTHYMSLYITQKQYQVSQLDEAIQDIEGVYGLDLTDVSRDSIGEG